MIRKIGRQRRAMIGAALVVALVIPGALAIASASSGPSESANQKADVLTTASGEPVPFEPEIGHARLDSAPPRAYAEAQARYDPDDEPNILLDRNTRTGEVAVVHIHPVDPIPAYVKTVEQFQKWAGTSRGED